MRARLALVVFAAAVVSLAATSPETREITDPKKIASAEVNGAGAVPIDDLFYTRNTGGGAWSPDGKEIVFSSNFTGRFNLWKVSSSGGWPIQLSQSDNRQGNAVCAHLLSRKERSVDVAVANPVARDCVSQIEYRSARFGVARIIASFERH